MTRRLLTAPLTAVLLACALASAALAVSGRLPTGIGAKRPASARAAAVSGSFSHSNSRDGQAILNASGMRPGSRVTGDVTIANTGDLAGAFRLARPGIAEQPGAGGGTLSTRLVLQVVDVSDAATPLTVWAGGLGAFTAVDLGTFAPGQARTYRFTATFPEGGPADNAWAGASSTVRFDWTSTADEPAAPAAPQGPGAAPPAAPASSGSPTRTASATVPGAIVRLTLPSGCVRRGGSFRATLRWKRVKRTGNVFVKVRRADFLVNGRRVLVDRRAPFAARFKIPYSAVAGSTLTVRARAYIEVRRGKSPRKSIRATVRVCE